MFVAFDNQSISEQFFFKKAHFFVTTQLKIKERISSAILTTRVCRPSYFPVDNVGKL
jgi:hypothetical protein